MVGRMFSCCKTLRYTNMNTCMSNIQSHRSITPPCPGIMFPKFWNVYKRHYECIISKMTGKIIMMIIWSFLFGGTWFRTDCASMKNDTGKKTGSRNPEITNFTRVSTSCVSVWHHRTMAAAAAASLALSFCWFHFVVLVAGGLTW